MLAILAFAPPNLAIHYFELLEKNNPPKLEPFFDSFEDNYRSYETAARMCSDAFNKNVVYVRKSRDWSSTQN